MMVVPYGDIIFDKIGPNRILVLGYTCFINRNPFQSYTINGNIMYSYGLEFILHGTSNEYGLQSVYNANGFIGVITELQQAFVAIYDTDILPFSYTGSENISITGNRVSLNLPIKINNEIVINPRAYDGAVFEIVPGTGNFAFRQNSLHGGTPIAQFDASTKECTFYGGLFTSELL